MRRCRPSYSNFGAAVAISAPGGGELSTAKYRCVRAGKQYLSKPSAAPAVATPRRVYRHCLAHVVSQSIAHAGGSTDQAAGLGTAVSPSGQKMIVRSVLELLTAVPQYWRRHRRPLRPSARVRRISLSEAQLPPPGAVLRRLVLPTGSDFRFPGTAPTAYLDWIYVSCSKAGSLPEAPAPVRSSCRPRSHWEHTNYVCSPTTVTRNLQKAPRSLSPAHPRT